MLFVLCVNPGGVLSSSAGSTVSSAYGLFLRKDLINGSGVTQRVCNHGNNGVLAPFHSLKAWVCICSCVDLFCPVYHLSVRLLTALRSAGVQPQCDVMVKGGGAGAVVAAQNRSVNCDYLSVSWACVWGQEEALGRERALDS